VTIDRPKISVCMAAFQGERYIGCQLRSILAQLADGDEVIVVDDHSSDKTCDEVRSLCDARIRLFEQDANQGVARTFEEALSHATGGVIFLSDQDDLWAPGKVARVMQTFEVSPQVTLVATDAMLIDERGERAGASYYASRGRFCSGFLSNLVRCKFLGCTMAFRSELLARVLPFPHDRDVLHDIWIGVINSVTNGRTSFIDEPLVCYRRHSSNVTGGELSRMRQMRTRWHLIKAVAGCWVRGRLCRRAGAPIDG